MTRRGGRGLDRLQRRSGRPDARSLRAPDARPTRWLGAGGRARTVRVGRSPSDEVIFKTPSRLVAESEEFDVLDGRSGRPRARAWRYMWAPLAGLAILVVLVVTTRVVLAVAGRKDDFRQAQIAIAAAGQTEFAMMHTPVGLIGGQVAGPDEYTLSAHLRFTLLGEMTQLQHYWPTPLARRTRADAQALAGQIVALMDLIRQHRLRGARALYQRPITPMSDTYLAELTRAQKALGADTNGADDRAAGAASGIAVVAGALLFLVSAAARGRLQ